MNTNIKLICIVGSHSCGKSTLMRALSEELPEFHIVDEVASLFPQSTRSYMETQCAIMRVQIEREKKCRPRLLSDRSVMDNLAYTRMIYSECPQTLEDGILLQFAESMYNRHMSSKPYDLIVFVDECLPIEDNGNRCLNPYYQNLIYESMNEIVTRAKERFDNFDILRVKGSTKKRMESIISFVNRN
jgi:nicotinamide riboside kinase